MKIYKMTATFGKLEHAELTLQPGLNILTAPNEWGKSTWCAFLVAMLYGLDTRAKTTKTALADKERYAPWSGNPMAGRIDLNWNGRDITIERSTKRRVPLGEFRAYETASGLPVEELNAAAKKYGEPRRTSIVYPHEITSYTPEEEQKEEYPVTVFLSREGYFKKITPQSLRASGEQKFKEGDGLAFAWETTNRAELLVFTDQFQCYKARLSDFDDGKASQLGDYSARSGRISFRSPTIP